MERNDYIGTAKAAAMLHITTRRVVGLCHEGKLIDAVQEGRNWKIPEESVRAYTGTAEIGDSLLPCAVRNTSYVEISSECYYVDITLLIRDLIDDHNMVTLFTRPRRFGKTLTINMLKTLLKSVEVKMIG
ncbi:MAG: AAA family ATPase [Clostridia bacterium]|nr:AAA family ATPase [Clostridia bacterium]